MTEEQASKQAQTLIELAGDLTAMYGGTTADAVRALAGALKGNNTMLDNYGMAANDAMIKTKALEMGLYDGTGQMDLATKQAATLALITEQSGAAQGQAAREAEGASGSMRAFATEVKNLSTDIGEVLLPVITPLLANLNDIVKKFGDLSPEMKKGHRYRCGTCRRHRSIADCAGDDGKRIGGYCWDIAGTRYSTDGTYWSCWHCSSCNSRTYSNRCSTL